MMFGSMWFVQTKYPEAGINTTNEFEVYDYLLDNQIIQSGVNPYELHQQMEDGIDRSLDNQEMDIFVAGVESLLTEFGIIPFDLSTIPDEPAGIH